MGVKEIFAVGFDDRRPWQGRFDGGVVSLMLFVAADDGWIRPICFQMLAIDRGTRCDAAGRSAICWRDEVEASRGANSRYYLFTFLWFLWGMRYIP